MAATADQIQQSIAEGAVAVAGRLVEAVDDLQPVGIAGQAEVPIGPAGSFSSIPAGFRSTRS